MGNSKKFQEIPKQKSLSIHIHILYPSHPPGEVNHIRRIVLACERDMEDFTAAMDAVNVDLDEMRARVDATHSIITSRQRVEATMTAEISTMRLDIGDIQEALKNHDSNLNG